MSTQPTPAPLPPEVQALLAALGTLNISLNIDVPVVTEALKLVETYRSTMPPDVLAAYDRMRLDWDQRWYAIVLQVWKGLGLPDPVKLPAAT